MSLLLLKIQRLTLVIPFLLEVFQCRSHVLVEVEDLNETRHNLVKEFLFLFRVLTRELVIFDGSLLGLLLRGKEQVVGFNFKPLNLAFVVFNFLGCGTETETNVLFKFVSVGVVKPKSTSVYLFLFLVSVRESFDSQIKSLQFLILACQGPVDRVCCFLKRNQLVLVSMELVIELCFQVYKSRLFVGV